MNSVIFLPWFQLTMQKSHKDSEITILHALVDAVQQSRPDCLDFFKDLAFVDSACSGWPHFSVFS